MMKVLIVTVGDQSEMDSEMGPGPLASPLLLVVSSTLLGQVRSGQVRYSTQATGRVWGHEIFLGRPALARLLANQNNNLSPLALALSKNAVVRFISRLQTCSSLATYTPQSVLRRQ